MQPAVLADAEDRHDVGVVQSRRGPRFPLEPLLLLRVRQHLLWQHLQRHMPPQGHLLGLVDDAHAAATDLPDDPVVAQLLQRDGFVPGSSEESLGSPTPSLCRSISNRAGNSSWIRSAHSG